MLYLRAPDINIYFYLLFNVNTSVLLMCIVELESLLGQKMG